MILPQVHQGECADVGALVYVVGWEAALIAAQYTRIGAAARQQWGSARTYTPLASLYRVGVNRDSQLTCIELTKKHNKHYHRFISAGLFVGVVLVNNTLIGEALE